MNKTEKERRKTLFFYLLGKAFEKPLSHSLQALDIDPCVLKKESFDDEKEEDRIRRWWWVKKIGNL